MKRLSALSAIIVCLYSLGIQAKPLLVGISSWGGYPTSVAGFKQALSSKGLVEGKDIMYIEKSAGADKNKQRAIAELFKRKEVDLVYSLTTSGTIIIKDVMDDNTPIVFSIVTYPADAGLIESMDYSANNLVGTSNYVPEEYFYELMAGVFPKAKSVLIFHRFSEPNSKIQAINLKRLIKKNGAKVKIVSAKSLADLAKKAKKYIIELSPDTLITTTDTLMQSGGEEVLIKLANESKIAILSSNKIGIEKGATLGPVADFEILGNMSGLMAAEILLESKLPTHMVSKFMRPPLILVNKKAFNKNGLSIPNHLENVRYVD